MICTRFQNVQCFVLQLLIFNLKYFFQIGFSVLANTFFCSLLLGDKNKEKLTIKLTKTLQKSLKKLCAQSSLWEGTMNGQILNQEKKKTYGYCDFAVIARELCPVNLFMPVVLNFEPRNGTRPPRHVQCLSCLDPRCNTVCSKLHCSTSMMESLI